MVRALAKVLSDLSRFDSSNGEVDDDAIGMEAFSADAGFETGSRGFDAEVVPFAKLLAQARQEMRFRPHDQDLVIDLGFEVSQGHSMLLEEAEEVLSGDPTVLRARDAISSQPARIEPLADRAGRDLADFRDLSGCEDFLHDEDSTHVKMVRDLGGFLDPSVSNLSGAARGPSLSFGFLLPNAGLEYGLRRLRGCLRTLTELPCSDWDTELSDSEVAPLDCSVRAQRSRQRQSVD